MAKSVTKAVKVSQPLLKTGGTISFSPSSSVSFNSQKITSVGTPTAGTDAANKTYVDTAVGVVTATAAAAPTRALVLFFA